MQDAAEKGSDVESLRKSGSIIYLDRAGNEVLRYKVSGCWPRRWKAPELNANADTVVASNEEMELACDRVDREP